MFPKTLTKAKQNQNLEILGLRFSEDWMCPKERFEELPPFGDRFNSIEIDSSPSNPHGIRSIAHSVLTLDFIDEEGHPTREALDRVIRPFYTIDCTSILPLSYFELCDKCFCQTDGWLIASIGIYHRLF